MTYIVKSPLVVAKIQDGPYVHIYEGGALPDNVDKDQLKQLVESKMVGKAEEPKPVDKTDDPKDGAPKGNASRAEWAEYAKSKGASEEELKDPADGGLTQSQLREKFGK